MSAAAFSSAHLTRQSTEALIAARELVSGILDFRARQTSLFDAPLVLVPKPAPPAAVSESVPSVLSPSSVSCYQDCSARWYYRKVLQLPESRTAALALGSAVHEAIAENFVSKVDTFADLPFAAVRSVFRDSFQRQMDEGVELAEDESEAELVGCGDALIRVYLDQAAPSIQPVAVELPVSGLIGGVQVHGIVDVLTDDGTVVDLKTAGRKPMGISAPHRLQISTYSMLAPGASGRGRIDTVTKTKTTAHYSTTFEVTPADVKLTERLYSITLDQMRSGVVAPNRGSFLCSRHNCSFWRECEDSFGGVVSE